MIIIFLDNNRKFVVFGYEVEFKYVEFVEDEEYVEYFYCWWFKMLLYNILRKEVNVFFFICCKFINIGELEKKLSIYIVIYKWKR